MAKRPMEAPIIVRWKESEVRMHDRHFNRILYLGWGFIATFGGATLLQAITQLLEKQ